MKNLAAVNDDFNPTKGIQRARRLPDPELGVLVGFDHPGRQAETAAPLAGDAELHPPPRKGRSQRHSTARRDPSRRAAWQPARPRWPAGWRIAPPSPSEAAASACSRSSRLRPARRAIGGCRFRASPMTFPGSRRPEETQHPHYGSGSRRYCRPAADEAATTEIPGACLRSERDFSAYDQRRRKHLHAFRHLCGGQHSEEPERHHPS